MSRNMIETVMGGVVLLVAGYFLLFAYNQADLKAVQGYELQARFAKVGGLSTGADVMINGIKVGSVTSQTLDPITYDAVVSMSIRPEIRLPSDTVASISSEGLMGGKFIKLDPGSGEEFLSAGGSIDRTRDFKSLEEMVGEIIFLATEPAAQGGSSDDASGLGSGLLD